MPNGQTDKRLEALKHFKDWSNYLLVTTVASLGWASTRTTLPEWAFNWSVGSLAASVVFAIFTLAFIPHIAEQIDSETSFYETTPTIHPVPLFPKIESMKVKWVCWPQHALFILGIGVYAWGSIAAR